MAERRYRQHCAVAKALDVVGDRWTLLVVRDLLDGPKRYVDLLDGLVSIPTDTLAARLRSLEAHGLVERVRLPPPADRTVYELTPSGRGLEAVIDAYARWGRPLIARRDPADAVRPQWLGLAVRSLLRADRAGVDLVLALRTPDGATALHITEGSVDTVDESTPADVTLTASVEDLAAAVDPARAGQLAAEGRLAVDGSPAHVRQLSGLFATPGA
jgi:DNA-binding HxlR family transcriptional regulator